MFNTKAELEPGVTYASKIPAEDLDSLVRYGKYGTPIGIFLLAVLTNDLTRAVQVASPTQFACLPYLTLFVLNELPASARGGTAEVYRYMRNTRMEFNQTGTGKK